MRGGKREGAGRPHKTDKTVYKRVSIRLLPSAAAALEGRRLHGETLNGCARRLLCDELLKSKEQQCQ
jgi:hypothetical protein